MHNSYEVRATKFIKQFAPFLSDCNKRTDYIHAVNRYNKCYHRHVQLAWGACRMVFITSDYVVKVDYDLHNISTFGGCESEYSFYQKAQQDQFGYLFAKVTPVPYKNRTFYIMPRVSRTGNIDEDDEDYTNYVNNEEAEYLANYVTDLHPGNYGFLHGRFLIIDYAANYA